MPKLLTTEQKNLPLEISCDNLKIVNNDSKYHKPMMSPRFMVRGETPVFSVQGSI